MKASTKKPSAGKSKATKSNKRKSNRSQRKNTLAVVIVAVLAGFIILAVGIVLSNSGNAASGQIKGLKTFTNLSRSHVTGNATFEQIPPVGGAHSAEWLNCGVYTEPVSNENAVHSLEHGAVWITYQPDLPAAEVQKLQDITRESNFRLLSPYPGIPSPIVVSAWGFQLKLKHADDKRLMQFINKYEQYPLGPEPGATCSGGVGEPVR